MDSEPIILHPRSVSPQTEMLELSLPIPWSVSSQTEMLLNFLFLCVPSSRSVSAQNRKLKSFPVIGQKAKLINTGFIKFGRGPMVAFWLRNQAPFFL